MAVQIPATVAIPGTPRWIAHAVVTPAGQDVRVWVVVRHRRLFMLLALLTGRVRLTRKAGL